MPTFNLKKMRLAANMLGKGETFTEVFPQDPYRTSPLVRPEDVHSWLGKRWLNNFPGSGAQQINKDKDTSENLRGQGNAGDFQDGSLGRAEHATHELEDPGTGKFEVRLRDGEVITPEMAKLLKDMKLNMEGRSPSVTVDTMDKAREIQRRIPGAIIVEK